jgi:peptidoglycan hydrolase CwlO-like protein
MTDEERQNLCERLRHLPAYLSEDGMRAAEEIERLAAELEATTDAENQQLSEAQMLVHDLREEIKYQHSEIERLEKERDSALAALRTTQKQYEEQRALEAERLSAEVKRLTALMSGNVRLVEELDDGAIFEVGP